ncbi:MAG: DUF5605 domain-containing protein [bacterium]|nr:DUF5605 domain-containing protein [bacterium]
MIKNYTTQVERWGLFELSVAGKTGGNPFVDDSVVAHFESLSEDKTVSGFYDGGGIYKIRFMPSFEETYRFTVHGSFFDDEISGEFTVLPPAENNHGPVRVSGKFHFEYADGIPYYPIGTTCYVWNLQRDELIEKTLESLKRSPFNKIRFCIFPKHYDYNYGEPRSYPYEGTPMDSGAITEDNFWSFGADSKGNNWDFERFCPEHFRHIEYCILELQKLGIEADIILFHPYDRWGFSAMTPGQNDLYLRYTMARLSAYRNVWWSFANEYDLIKSKTVEDWEQYAKTVTENDPYNHLRSIHNCAEFYDHSRPWITHCSIQRSPEGADEWRKQYGKPVVIDEMAYEGNLQYGWGNFSAQEIVRRFWEAACRGGYGGHGETYLDRDAIWWSHGGVLKGESPSRIAFLKKIIEEAPSGGLRYKPMSWDETCAVPEEEVRAEETGYHLFYFGIMRPSFHTFHFDDEYTYRVDVIDTWNMTVENRGEFKGRFKILLPAREYMAVRVTKSQKV